jgi:hypothetical protein
MNQFVEKTKNICDLFIGINTLHATGTGQTRRVVSNFFEPVREGDAMNLRRGNGWHTNRLSREKFYYIFTNQQYKSSALVEF